MSDSGPDPEIAEAISLFLQNVQIRKLIQKLAECMAESRARGEMSWDRMFSDQFRECIGETWEIPEYQEFLPPPPPVLDMRSIQVSREILDNPENAMIFSKYVERAFKEAGIKLEDNETFACLIYITRKDPEIIRRAQNYLMEPEIMKQRSKMK